MSIQPRKISAALAAEKSISLLIEELYGNTSKKAIALLLKSDPKKFVAYLLSLQADSVLVGAKHQQKSRLLLQKVGGL